MSAVAEALEQSHRQTIAAVQKAFLRGHLDNEQAEAFLDTAGIPHSSDRQTLLSAWETLRILGAEAPAETPAPKSDPASQRQLDFIRQLCNEHGLEEPNITLSKTQASEVIDKIRANTYDASEYTVPF